MNKPVVTVTLSARFLKDVKRLKRKYPNVLKDLKPLTDQIQNHETPGEHVPGVGYPTYKVRVKNSDVDKGKSGGYGVIYYIQTPSAVFLVTIYTKSEEENISPGEIRALVNEILNS